MRSWKLRGGSVSVTSMPTKPIPAGAVVDAQTNVRHAAQRLRNTLRLNAVTSLLGGVAAMALGGPVNTLLGTDSAPWARLVGFGLVVFAVDVVYVSGASIRLLKRYTPLISAADALWVVASVTTVALGWFSTTGSIVIGIVAGAVGAFSVRQIILVQRLTTAAKDTDPAIVNETPPTEVFHVEAPISATAPEAWAIVTDHELYGKLAPNLGSVVATAPNGENLARACFNRSGEGWNETCTLWSDGEQFDIEVDTTNYPYPLAEMRGSWWVRQTTPHTTIGMDFRYRPTATIKGRLFAIGMQAAFPVVLRRIIGGWQATARRAPTAP